MKVESRPKKNGFFINSIRFIFFVWLTMNFVYLGIYIHPFSFIPFGVTSIFSIIYLVRLYKNF